MYALIRVAKPNHPELTATVNRNPTVCCTCNVTGKLYYADQNLNIIKSVKRKLEDSFGHINTYTIVSMELV